MAKIIPVIVEESKPIIYYTICHRLEVQLVAKGVKLKSKVQILQGEHGEGNMICVGAFVGLHRSFNARIDIDSQPPDADGHERPRDEGGARLGGGGSLGHGGGE
jgi:hypothetical protein